MMYGVRQFWASTVRPYVRYVIVRKIRTCTAFGLSLLLILLGGGVKQVDEGSDVEEEAEGTCGRGSEIFNRENKFF